jgi:hypothetical protein
MKMTRCPSAHKATRRGCFFRYAWAEACQHHVSQHIESWGEYHDGLVLDTASAGLGRVSFLFWLLCLIFVGKKWLRAAIGVIVMVTLFTFPVRDELKGMDEFEALCARGGVYDIPKSAEGKAFDLAFQATPYKSLSGYALPIREKTISFVDVASGEVVAAAKVYAVSGGWLVQKKILALTSTNGPLLGRSDCRPPDSEEVRLQKITNKMVN